MPADIPPRRELRPDAGEPAVGDFDILASLGRFVRFGVTLFGVGVMLLGAILTASVFFQVSDAFTQPEKFQDTVKKWAEVAGGDSLNVPQPNGPPIPLGGIAGMAALGFAGLLMGYLSMGILACGARIVAWTTDDRKAVKDILDYAWQQRGNERGL